MIVFTGGWQNRLALSKICRIVCGLVAATTTALALATAAEAQTGKSTAQGLSIKMGTVWASNNIPVCWENGMAGTATAQQWVRDAIAVTWEKESVVRFTGWGACTKDSKGIRIFINDENPHTKALGSDLNGVVNGMVLDFTYATFSPNCQNGGKPPGGYNNPGRIAAASELEFCDKIIAVHEFGHALGIAHEQNRSDAPACSEPHQGTDGDFNVTAYDLQSIMNYCNPAWNGGGNLSQQDVAGVVTIYGRNANSIASARNGLSAVRTVARGASVFTVGDEGDVWSFFYDPRVAKPVWSAGFRLSPVKTSSNGQIAAVSTVEGGVSLFTLAPAGDVVSAYFDPRNGNRWSSWFSLGGANLFGPAGRPDLFKGFAPQITAVSSVPGGISLFVVGNDGAVWTAFFDPRVARPVWSSWSSLGGKVRAGSTIQAVSSVAGGVSLFVISADNSVYTNFFDPRVPQAKWSGWFPLAGEVRGDARIAAVSSKPGGVSLFAIGRDNAVHTAFFDPDLPNAKWSSWVTLGGRAAPGADLAAVSTVRGGVSLFTVQDDHNVYSAFYDPRVRDAKWSSWFSVGGQLGDFYQISAITPAEGAVSLFTKRRDGYAQSAYFDPADPRRAWSDWFPLAK